MRPRIIALYLPQYHPFKENDEWWGKGFTEWTSVGRAKPLFKGHYQPRVPADLGYYDLRLPIVREQQAELAREAGIEGFCYWHYWFGNGQRLMERVFDEVLESGKPDFPFCLGWANHSWFAKNWNSKDTKGSDKLLIEQKYLGDADYRMHYEFLLKAFKDPRYIKYNGMPVFMIYDANSVPTELLTLWQKWIKEDGFKDGIYFVGNFNGNKYSNNDYSHLLTKGFNAVTMQRTFRIRLKSGMFRFIMHAKGWYNQFRGKPFSIFEYKEASKHFVDKEEDSKEDFVPTIIPNFDHSPRSGKYGNMLHGATPELFKEHAKQVLGIVAKKKNPLIFLKSWNEWGEGNYMEPDLKYGKGFINALKEAINEKVI